VLDENSKLSINIRKAALLNKIGRKEEARKLYEEVVENGSKLHVVEEAKEKLKKLVNNEN
jgi:hypothetical protein